MDIKQYIDILWRRKWIIVLTSVVTLAVSIIITLMMKPIYSATTTMRIALTATGTVSYQDYVYGDRLMNTYVKLATTEPVLTELKQKLGLSFLPSIAVKTVPQTELLQVIVTSQDPSTSSLAANTLADILIAQSSELYTGSGESSLEILRQQVSLMEQEVNLAQADYENLIAKNSTDTEAIRTSKEMLDFKKQMYSSLLEQYEQTRLKASTQTRSIYVVDPALPPSKPSKPNKLLNIALGFVVGMLGGLGLAFLFENLDTTMYTTDQIEKVTNLPTIGKIPCLKRQNSFIDLNNNFAYGEAFRRLRMSILSSEFPIRSLLITSADPREGKSKILANLAYTMSQSGRHVVVIDCDLRLPSQYKIFHIDNNIGLSTILEQKTVLEDAIQPTEFQGIHVLPSGPLPPNPSELLDTDQMKALINQLKEMFDIALIDAPAALAVTDASVLAPMVDAIALVVSRAMTTSKKVNAVQTQLSKYETKWIGVIINRTEPHNDLYYYDKKKHFFRKN